MRGPRDFLAGVGAALLRQFELGGPTCIPDVTGLANI